MVNQAKQCKKGYSCGKGCINVMKVCRKGLTGQAVTLADNYFELAKKANQTTVSGGGQAVAGTTSSPTGDGGSKGEPDITPEEALQWEKDLANQAMGWDQPSDDSTQAVSSSEIPQEIKDQAFDKALEAYGRDEFYGSPLDWGTNIVLERKEPVFNKLRELREGGAIATAEKELAAVAAQQMMKKVMGGKLIDKSADKVQEVNPDLDRDEAYAMKAWVSNAYGGINQQIYNGENPEGEAVAIGLQAVLMKDEKLDSEGLNGLREKAAESGKPTTDIDNDEYFLKRHIKLEGDEAIDVSLGGYLDAFFDGDNDGIVTEPTFFATTMLDWESDNESFARGTNVSFEVKPKLESGNGVPVDKYKNKVFEGEVLYPAMQNFKVNDVQVTDLDGNPIELNSDPVPDSVFEIFNDENFSDDDVAEVFGDIYSQLLDNPDFVDYLDTLDTDFDNIIQNELFDNGKLTPETIDMMKGFLRKPKKQLIKEAMDNPNVRVRIQLEEV